jgi:hypothetical protein
MKLLFDEYREALKKFGTCLNPFPEKDDISDMMDWMLKEFQALPRVISGARDFTAIFLWKACSSFSLISIALTFRSFIEHSHDSQMLRVPHLSELMKMFTL